MAEDNMIEKNKMMKEGNSPMGSKKGQVAIFVIIALAIVCIILLVLLYPRIKISVAPEIFNPEEFLRSCIEGEVKERINILASHGGYENPTGYIIYKGEKIKYLCYIKGYYKTCVVQEPMIKSVMERELERALKTRINTCAANLKSEYERRGFSVNMGAVNSDVEIAMDKIKVNFVVPMKISKGETTKTFEKFSVEIKSKMYDLLMITTSIIDFESTYGDSEITLYLQYYPNLKIEKVLYDGSRIYNVSDVTTGESFVFASRSLVWPPGYGVVDVA